MKDLTWLCDSGSCEHETDVKHERGSGVLCAECRAKSIKYAFEPEQKEGELGAIKSEQSRRVQQD